MRYVAPVPVSAAVACPECGASVVLPPDLARELPLCASCARRLPAPFSGTFSIRTASGHSALDGAGVVERLRAGQLLGTDWIVDESGEATPVAAHPAFAALLVQGLIPEFVPVVIPPPTPDAASAVNRPPNRPRALAGSFARIVASVVVLAALGAAGVWAWEHQAAIELKMQESVTAVVEPKVAPAASGPIAPLPPAPKLIEALVARVGVVGETRSTLLARAWAARLGGGLAGQEAAVTLAEQAVARSPNDPESLGLLAELLADLRREGPLVDELLTRCEAAGAGIDACARARAAKVIASGDVASARGIVQDCAGKGDLPCRALYVATVNADGLHASEALAAVDKLAGDWSTNRELARKGAVLAASLDLPEALARVESVRRDVKGDLELDAALGTLLLRDGNSKDALEVVAAMGDAAPVALRVDLSLSLAGSGRYAEAKALLGDLPTRPNLPEGVQAKARLALAQAAYQAAAADPTQIEAAKAAVTSMVELGRSDPAVAQVRALIANLYGNHGEEVKSWSSIDESKRSGAALARVLDTQVALGVAARLSVSELIPLAERARRADPQSGDTHLWLAWVHLVGGNAPQAVDVLRASILTVDGQALRRRPDVGTLANRPPTADVLTALERGVGNDATFGRSYEVAVATVHFLAGNLGEARRQLDKAGNVEDDPETLALRARMRTLSKDAALAVTDWQRVTQERPKEPAYLLGLLQALVAANRTRDAVPLMETVSSSPLVTPQVLVVRAEVRAASGEHAAALRDLQDAIARDPYDVQSRVRHRRLAAGK